MTYRQWISIGLNLIVGNAILVLFELFGRNQDHIALPLVFSFSGAACVLFFLAFKLLKWDASGPVTTAASAIVSFLVPILGIALVFLPNPAEALTAAMAAGILWKFALPLFAMNCVLVYWATRERRTNR